MKVTASEKRPPVGNVSTGWDEARRPSDRTSAPIVPYPWSTMGSTTSRPTPPNACDLARNLGVGPLLTLRSPPFTPTPRSDIVLPVLTAPAQAALAVGGDLCTPLPPLRVAALEDLALLARRAQDRVECRHDALDPLHHGPDLLVVSTKPIEHT